MKTTEQIVKEYEKAVREKSRLVDDVLRYRGLVKQYPNDVDYQWNYEFVSAQANIVDGIVKALSWVLRYGDDVIIQPLQKSFS